jgi:hypothetical protein
VKPSKKPVFTRRHYRVIALAILETRKYLESKHYLDGPLDSLVMNLCNKFERDNPAFRSVQFINATRE